MFWAVPWQFTHNMLLHIHIDAILAEPLLTFLLIAQIGVVHDLSILCDCTFTESAGLEGLEFALEFEKIIQDDIIQDMIHQDMIHPTIIHRTYRTW